MKSSEKRLGSALGGYWAEMPEAGGRRASRSPARARPVGPGERKPGNPLPAPGASNWPKPWPKPCAAGGVSSISAAGWAVLTGTYFAYVCIYCARKPFAVVKARTRPTGFAPAR